MEYPTNQEIAEVLESVADLLEAQDANPYKVQAYRRAVRTIRDADLNLAEIATSEDWKKLDDLPNIGESIAGSIREFASTRRLGLLERLKRQVSPVDLFTTVPGVGKELARRIHDELGIDTLEDLELAAHDYSLEKVPGLGERRVKAIRESLAGMLDRSTRRRAKRIRHIQQQQSVDSQPESLTVPAVSLLLKVDEKYRTMAETRKLRTIAPRRFNPDKKSWLPIMHEETDGWRFTAMYSNTARAHTLERTHDWVVIHYERNGYENRCTVVTERQGSLRGRRVIRGREGECREFYTQSNPVLSS
jgi:hypothetical protein